MIFSNILHQLNQYELCKSAFIFTALYIIHARLADEGQSFDFANFSSAERNCSLRNITSAYEDSLLDMEISDPIWIKYEALDRSGTYPFIHVFRTMIPRVLIMIAAQEMLMLHAFLSYNRGFMDGVGFR